MFLIAELGLWADSVHTQDFVHTGYSRQRLSLTNIIGTFNPSAPERILLCAHWDTRPRAEHDEDKSKRDTPIIGANDAASGVAVLLEIARHLKEHPPPVGVDIVFFDGEDYGREGDTRNYLLGSRYFAANRAPDYVPRFGILLDMVGDTYLEIPREENSMKLAPDVVDLVWNKAKELGFPQFLDLAGDPVIDDHLPLNEAGIKTIDIIDFDYPDPTNRFWHTHKDIPENCSPGSLAAVGTVLLHVVYTQRP
jgi:Zn-dependent M28 family amino/carboxypeptidase